jgi:predicted ATPase
MDDAVRFSRLRLRNWRNFRAVDVALERRVFVVGPNAVGKSNLLDVFRFLRDLTLDGGGLAAAVKDRGGISRLRSLHARKTPAIEVDVEVTNASGGWRYQLEFDRRGKDDFMPEVRRETVQLLGAEGTHIETVLSRPDTADHDDPERLRQTALQQVTQNQKFRELWEFFGTVRYLHLVPQLIREVQKPREDALGPDPFGRDLLDRVRNTPARSKEARLKRIEELLKIAVPKLSDLQLTVDRHGLPHLAAKFEHWRGQKATQDETQFSDGTLRLIGLLWMLQEKAGPLLLEEPELSLHSAIVRQLPPFIARAQRRAAGRQAIISTHSDDMMSDPGIAASEVLLVRPVEEGSEVILGAALADIASAMNAGLTAADVVMPKTRPEQIGLFATEGL